MKKIRHISVLMITLAFFVAVHSPAQEQWVPYGPPPWTSSSITTTGGVTYFLHSAILEVCRKIETGPVVRSGTNISLAAAELVWTGNCILCVNCQHTQTSAVILGDLPAGKYRLHIYSYASDPFEPPSPWPSLWMIRDFEVPAQTGRTLELTSGTNEVRISLHGVPAATYVLETSTNLLNWTSLHTNQGGPFVFTNPVATDEGRFFRARVDSGTINAP